ncbi:hypothetical protein OS493_007604 [Desmophyllum pertusum]|uniref:RING-type domain-containing protein n=1 Tax=Desmophyllum pertusum TaxID=174260 RepID=A0A9W9YRP8_9CNID|nr:hypothetical protein OS493_007604 [Desmophyllum pertusum]
MAARGHHLPPKSAEENLSCPVCLEIFQNPPPYHAVTQRFAERGVPMHKRFCNDCLNSCENASGSSTCPVCRAGFNVRQKLRARDIEQQILQSTGSCSGCNRQLRMSRLREHRSSCATMSYPSFSPVASTSQPETKNRSTFTCPLCYQSNLDSNGMLKHVNSKHKNERQSVVCPICASMPWGNPHQKSGDFVQHFNLRHKFEYETFVDYDNDEDAILQQVLAQSMQDN